MCGTAIAYGGTEIAHAGTTLSPQYHALTKPPPKKIGIKAMSGTDIAYGAICLCDVGADIAYGDTRCLCDVRY
eukprot:1956251-Rhodomonas_salina.2